MLPVGTERLTPSTARVSPKSLTRFTASTAGSLSIRSCSACRSTVFPLRFKGRPSTSSGRTGSEPPVDRGQSLEEAIREEAERIGFPACGFASADSADAAGLDLRRWLEAGRHGTMGWMETRADQRVSPRALWPDARSAIALAMSYAPAGDPLALGGKPELGRISVYAQG